MARPAKPTLFDRKLQELEQQSDLIQNDIRSLSKSLRKIEEGGELPPLRSRTADARATARAGTAQQAAPPRARDTTVSPASGRALPSLAPLGGDDDAEIPAEERMPAPLVVDARRPGTLKTPKFANYLASGSFGTARPLAQERRIQRNKAIFMVVVLGLALLMVLQFMF